MYTSYFGLTEKPFAIAPNPKYLYMSDAHREALAHLLYGINGEGCISLLTGNIGTGKTTVCRCLIEQSPSNTDIAIILNPKLSIEDLLCTICEELGITVGKNSPTVKSYTDAINRYLLKAHANRRNTALIIDEAQNLDIEILEHLRLLTNLETNTKKLLQIILIGQPELRKFLEDPALEQVNQRITARFHLGPLQTESVVKYVHHRIEIAGGTATHKLFDPKSLHYLAAVSRGIPRVINLLCDRALLGAYAENKDQVTLAIIRKAVHEIKSGSSKKPKPRWKVILAALLISLIVLVPTALYIFHPESAPKFTTWLKSDPPPEEKPTTPAEENPVQESLEVSQIKIHPLVNESVNLEVHESSSKANAANEQE